MSTALPRGGRLDPAAPPKAKSGGGLNGLTTAGLAIIGTLALVALLAPYLAGDLAAQANTAEARQGPSISHLFGTDAFGRDVFARALVSTRLTMILTGGAGLIAITAGTLVGVAIQVFPSLLRRLVLQLNAVAVALPSMILALVVAAILGPGSTSAMVAVGVANIPVFIRLTSALATGVAGQDYVTQARLFGVPGLVVAVRHLLPNIATPLAVIAASSMAFTLVELSSLSFIGLGVQVPEYDYGKMLFDGLALMNAQPWAVTGPSVMITLLGLGIILLGDGIAAASDPKLRRAARAHLRNPRDGVVRLLAEEDRLSAVDGAPNAEETPAADVRRLTVTTSDGVPLVREVSLRIAPGEIVGLVGESGSGKSLTALSLAGLAPQSLRTRAEAIKVGSADLIAGAGPASLVHQVALVYQDPMSTFSPLHRIGTQLTEVRRTYFGLGRKQARAELAEAFAQVSITDPEQRLRQYPHQLSGGMLQRALIAGALLTGPALLVADEPTTALDVTVQADVLRKIYRFREQTNAAVLFISHDLGVVEAICDRILVMYKGEIVEEISPAQLATRDVTHPYTQRLLNASRRFGPTGEPATAKVGTR
ncbi:MAG: dipeptide/oligopeptide/nickel ABC transporter permease/ATP-binding protein [Bifidobacteriaceae bacterium]|jgi:ABC-type dipeptide/oligopeptide/nickel transport system ATPase component/ABC-type dipeptide/oligopeptide/nickel transport system permease subunit|nr:dipeptide/oligopeptide/nickel ABC transporter permease/ATP-binding protein [Bifidobacteriaceae bacterium]